jgi:osmotically inducible lipoprotein OsmB
MNSKAKAIVVIVLTAGLSACAGMTHTEADTAIGAGTGAVVGGALTGGSALGVVGGAAVGGVIGHEVGEGQDRNERRRR